tara:strand:+ start:7698 stop:8282 length:585 start_codon:yes stop_codon:yes gene_type:complete
MLNNTIDKEIPQQAYVYSHVRKDTGRCFYIGKGRGKRAWNTQLRNRHWNFVANKSDFKVKILVSGLTDDKALELEKNFIDQIGLENLTNVQEGGQGGWSHTHTPEIVKKRGKAISKAKTGKKFSGMKHTRHFGSGNPKSKKVMWVEKNKIFDTTDEVKEYFNISTHCFHRIIRKGPSTGNARRKDLDNITLKYI